MATGRSCLCGSFTERSRTLLLHAGLCGLHDAGNAARAGISLQARQICAQFRGVLIAHAAIFFERLGNCFFQARRNVWIEAHSGQRRFFQDGIEDDRGCCAAEWNRARSHFVEHGTEAEKIAAHVQCFSARLLRRHICHRADRRPSTGEIGFAHRRRVYREIRGIRAARSIGRCKNLLGQAEIQNFRVAAVGDE